MGCCFKPFGGRTFLSSLTIFQIRPPPMQRPRFLRRRGREWRGERRMPVWVIPSCDLVVQIGTVGQIREELVPMGGCFHHGIAVELPVHRGPPRCPGEKGVVFPSNPDAAAGMRKRVGIVAHGIIGRCAGDAYVVGNRGMISQVVCREQNPPSGICIHVLPTHGDPLTFGHTKRKSEQRAENLRPVFAVVRSRPQRIPTGTDHFVIGR